MGSLLRRLGEEHAVVRKDPDRVALDAREPGDEGLAVQCLELIEAGAVDDAGDQLACVGLVPVVLRDEAVQLGGICRRRLGLRHVPGRFRLAAVQIANDLACERERVIVRGGVVVSHARLTCMDVGAA